MLVHSKVKSSMRNSFLDMRPSLDLSAKRNATRQGICARGG